MNRWLWLAALTPLTMGCKDKVEVGPDSGAPRPIVVGIITGREGSSASSALAVQPAFEAAIGAVNAAGGIEGRQIVVEYRDDKDKEGEIIQGLANDVIGKRAIGILGPIRSKQLQDMSVATIGVVPVLSPSATSPDLIALNNPDPWVFRTVPNDNAQAEAMVKFARAGLAGNGGSCNRMAIVHQNDSYGTGLKNALKSSFERAGGIISGTKELGQSAQESYETEIDEIASRTPDCMAFIGVEDVGGAFMISLQSYREFEPTAFPESFYVIGADGFYNDGFLSASRTDRANPNTSTANGMFGTVPEPNPTNWPAYSEYMTLHRQFDQRREPLTSYVAAAFDAAALLLLARAAAQSDNPVDVRNQLVAVSSGGEAVSPATLARGIQLAARGEDINYVGASGPVDFLPGADVEAAYSVWTVQNGKFVTIGSYRPEDL